MSLGFFSAPSTAAVVSGTWSFSATGAVGAENVVFEGSFTTSFDNSASATLNPADITVNALNLLPGFTGTVGASYLQASDALIFGYTIAGAGGLTAATNDFRIIFSPSAAPSNDTFVYTRAGANVLFNVPIVTTDFTPAGGSWHLPPLPDVDSLPQVVLMPPEPSASVAEPTTIALLSVAFAGLGFSRRKSAK